MDNNITIQRRIPRRQGSDHSQTGREHLEPVVIAGFSTNRCVGLTAIDAWELDFKVILAGDAILGTNLADGQLMLDYLEKSFQIEPVKNDDIMKMISEGA